MKKNLPLAVALIGTLAGTAFAIDGVEPPIPTDPGYSTLFEAMEGVCGWGRTLNLDDPGDHNNFCSGVLVAPNIILTAAHCQGSTFNPDAGTLIGPDDLRMQAKDSNGNVILDVNGVPVPMYTARFRLNPNGSVGSFGGGSGSFYQVPVKYVLASPEIDMMLLILADGANDLEDNGIWTNGYISHINPIPLAPIQVHSSARFTGYGAAFGPLPDGSEFGIDRGILRYTEFDDLHFQDVGGPVGTSPVAEASLYQANQDVGAFWVGDSGGVTLSIAENGDVIASAGVPGGAGIGGARALLDFAITWDLFFDATAFYGMPVLHSASNLDVTDDASEFGIYGVSDWRLDTNDALAIASQNPASGSADWNGDSVVNATDFLSYSKSLILAINPYFENPIFPLEPRDADIDGNRRFNINDSSALTAFYGSTNPEDIRFDFNGDGVIDAADGSALETVRTRVDGSQSISNPDYYPFDHGIYADADYSGVIDFDDLETVRLSSSSFENVDNADSSYNVLLDLDLDQNLDATDRDLFAVRFVPGDTVSFSGELETDLYLSVNDLNTFALKLSHAVRNGGEYPLPIQYFNGFDTTSEGWSLGDNYQIPDGAYTIEDAIYAMSMWMTPFAESYQTESLLDFWFYDLNGDGRVNILDMRQLETSLGATNLTDWDFNNNGVIDTQDLDTFVLIVFAESPFGHGFLGDIDGGASPSCTCDGWPDNLIFAFLCQDQQDPAAFCDDPVITTADCVDLSLIVTDTTGLFTTGRVYGDSDFIVQLDGNLDGEMDLDDRSIVFHHLQPGDITFDGFVDVNDITDFIARLPAASGSSEGDSNYDIDLDINRDGMIDFFDVSALIGYASSPNCS